MDHNPRAGSLQGIRRRSWGETSEGGHAPLVGDDYFAFPMRFSVKEFWFTIASNFLGVSPPGSA